MIFIHLTDCVLSLRKDTFVIVDNLNHKITVFIFPVTNILIMAKKKLKAQQPMDKLSFDLTFIRNFLLKLFNLNKIHEVIDKLMSANYEMEIAHCMYLLI